ncbi:hypothetical protein BBJ28_00006964 [Nothophytophthora sp. Chile5]|nr:hypothetical protein BBJ28_00006964 [Nothophytophthora sp. Chile5]
MQPLGKSLTASDVLVLGMIRPFGSKDELSASSLAVVACYQTVACSDLPAFDPIPTLKTLLLSPQALKRFNATQYKLGWLVMPTYSCGLLLRVAVYACPASVGRIIAPCSALLHVPAIIVFSAGIRIEFAKLILRTFDFWFPFVANTVLFVVFSAVLSDARVVLTTACWVAFAGSFLQETYFRDSLNIATTAFIEALCLLLLMVVVSLEILDGVRHTDIFAAGGHSLSTKDMLVNVFGTMATLMLRTMYRRLTQVKPPPLLQIHLVKDSRRYDPRETVWPRIGSLQPLPIWQVVGMYTCGAMGLLFSIPSIFASPSRSGDESSVIAVLGLVASGFFCGVQACCCHRKLLKRVTTSFDYLFLMTQLLTAHLGLCDVFHWRWASSCGVAASLLWTQWTLTADALTPSMKRRLHFKSWMPTCGIVMFLLAQSLLMLSIMVWDYWSIQDRVFWDLQLLGRRTQFRVVPFLFSRLITIFVWYSRLLYILLTRKTGDALILLLGREQQVAPPSTKTCYQIVTCSELPAFDPVPTLKTLVLSSQGVKRFNGLVFKSRHLFMPSFSLGVVLRFAAFAAPAPVGRVLAPVSALLHAPSIVMFLSGIRTEFANIVLRTFDCWILIVANALWLIVLSAVLGDLRVLLVVACWAQFTDALLQETYMHVSRNIGLLALGEALFLVLLMMSLSAGLLDDVQHYDLIATRNHTLSTKDVLVNVSGTMATLMLRTTYRRLQQAQHQKDDAGSAMQSLQFHCRIALQAMKASAITTQSSVVPTVGPLLRGTSKVEVAPEDLSRAMSTQINRSSKQPLPLQMTLATVSGRFDSQQTVWPCIGSEKPLANWQFAAFHTCGDRVLWDFELAGRHVEFHVVPFLLRFGFRLLAPPMIHPSKPPAEEGPRALPEPFYQLIGCAPLPAFDPVLTLKARWLSPHAIKVFNGWVLKIHCLVVPAVSCGMLLRIAVFGAPAPIGRILAPVSAILHIPSIVVFTAGIRLEFAKLLLQTFEFWFALVTNTIWLVVFSVVLGDLRVLLVAMSGLNFASSLLQETYLRDSLIIVGLATIEALYLVVLVAAVSVELLDGVQHCNLVSARNHTLSTKDVLVNVIGTMITLMIRTMYRRLLQFKHQKDNPGTAVQSLGYRCRIAFAPSTTGSDSILPYPIGPLPQAKTKQTEVKATSQHPPLQMHLVPDPERFDARNTLLLMLDLLMWDDSDLQDRVVWDFQILDRPVRFQVVPFLLSRLFTIFVWCGRLLYALVTRKSDNTLMLLHGNVQYDYQHWKLQMKSADIRTIGAK